MSKFHIFNQKWYFQDCGFDCWSPIRYCLQDKSFTNLWFYQPGFLLRRQFLYLKSNSLKIFAGKELEMRKHPDYCCRILLPCWPLFRSLKNSCWISTYRMINQHHWTLHMSSTECSACDWRRALTRACEAFRKFTC